MIQDPDQNLLVVLLEDLVQHHLPKLLAIRDKTVRGETLTARELDFLRKCFCASVTAMPVMAMIRNAR